METGWDDSYNQSVTMDGYKLFRRESQERRAGGVALYVRERFNCLELSDGDDRVECLWLRSRGKADKAALIVEPCYRPPNQDEYVDKISHKQLGQVSQLCDFNLSNVCWKYNTAERKQSRMFPECLEDNFLIQLVSKPTRESAVLDLLFTNRGRLVDNVMIFGIAIMKRQSFQFL